MLAMVVLVGLGEKMAERFLPLYLMALGGGALSVGLLGGLDNLLSALYSLPGGWLSDRLGYKRALLIFNGMAMAGYAVVILVPTWQAGLAGAVLFISWTAISLPATMDLVASVLPKHRRTLGVSLHSLVRRVPMGLGPVLGGLLIGACGERQGIRLAFLLALLLAGLAMVLQQLFIAEAPRATREKPPGNGMPGLGLLGKPLRHLLVADILVRFCEQIPYAFVVIWCVRNQGVSPFQFGLLTAIEMGTAMAVYLPVAWLADRGTKKPYIVTTFVCFTLFPLMLLRSRSFAVLALAFVLRGLKEFGEPARKALILDLAPEGRKAATFGVYYLFRDMVVSLSAFGGALLWDGAAVRSVTGFLGLGSELGNTLAGWASPALNLGVAAAFGLAGTLYFLVFGSNFQQEKSS